MAILQWARGQLTQKQVGSSHNHLVDIARPDVNIVHLQRRQHPLHARQRQLQRLAQDLGGYKRQVAAVVGDPEPAAHELLLGLQHAADQQTLQLLHEDICELARQYALASAPAQGGAPEHVHVKLEVLGFTPCPRWHADHVTARLLCTYTGPGTWYVPNRHVQRRLGWAEAQPVTAVASVEEQAAVQVGPTDLLLLKGHAWPGCWGLGAVHRSPLVNQDGNFHVTQVTPGQDLSYKMEAAEQDHQHCQCCPPAAGQAGDYANQESHTLVPGQQGSHYHQPQAVAGGSMQECQDAAGASNGLRLLLTIDDARFGWMHGADGERPHRALKVA